MQSHVFTIAKLCSSYGANHAVICPGSRSAPLVYAFTKSPGITCYSAIDERSAAFMAMGMAQQLQKPVVLICTSGTACLNFFPAIAEAFYQKIPLLIITADRPPELLNQQDGQMIMQKGVFGKHVISSHELLCFDEDKIDYTLNERIVSLALLETMLPTGFGPVHLNVPLREPLYNFNESNTPTFTGSAALQLPAINLQTDMLDEVLEAWKNSKNRMLIVGQMPVSDRLKQALLKYAKKEDVIIIADVVSNQYNITDNLLFDAILQYTPPANLNVLEPDFILSLGGPLVSKALKIWLKQQKPTFHFRVQGSPSPVDTYNNVTHFIHTREIEFLEKTANSVPANQTGIQPYSSAWAMCNLKVKNTINTFLANLIWCEPTVMHYLLKSLPQGSQLQLANSSVVRYASWLGVPNNVSQVYANRGTSGIDGSVSTALGSARMNPDKIVTLISGDLSLFYDSNALWQKHLPVNFKIVVLNNGGGRIFEWIDGPSDHRDALEYFTTPQMQSVQLLAQQFGLSYFYSDSFETLGSTLINFFDPENKCAILELYFTGPENINQIKAFKNLRTE